MTLTPHISHPKLIPMAIMALYMKDVKLCEIRIPLMLIKCIAR